MFLYWCLCLQTAALQVSGFYSLSPKLILFSLFLYFYHLLLLYFILSSYSKCFCCFSAVQEMIAIMQEHGEVVCCVGSSFNVNNTSIFTQADIRYVIFTTFSSFIKLVLQRNNLQLFHDHLDCNLFFNIHCSVAIEPLFPQLCLKGLPKDFRSGTPQLQTGNKNPNKAAFDMSSVQQDSSSSDMDNGEMLLIVACNAYISSINTYLAIFCFTWLCWKKTIFWNEGFVWLLLTDLSPLELSALLNSLPCSLSFHRDTDFKFKSLLKEVPRS